MDFILSGRLEKLEEVDYEGGVRVEVALSAQITDPRAGKTVWANAASESARGRKANRARSRSRDESGDGPRDPEAPGIAYSSHYIQP